MGAAKNFIYFFLPAFTWRLRIDFQNPTSQEITTIDASAIQMEANEEEEEESKEDEEEEDDKGGIW